MKGCCHNSLINIKNKISSIRIFLLIQNLLQSNKNNLACKEKDMKTLFLIFSFIFAGVIFFSLPSFSQDIQKGLIAYWKFDGDAKDSSGKGYNGKENGDIKYVDGKFGKAVSLESDRVYIEVDNNVDIQLKADKPFTISCYVKPSNTKHGDIMYHGLGCSTWSSWFLGMQGAEPDAALVPDSFVFGVRTANGGAYTGISAKAGAGSWIHIAGIHDGSTMRLYIDGKEEAKKDTSDLPYASNEKLYIGGDPGCGGRSWYTGLLDDVRLFSRALSVADVGALVKGSAAIGYFGKLAVTWGEVKE